MNVSTILNTIFALVCINSVKCETTDSCKLIDALGEIKGTGCVKINVDISKDAEDTYDTLSKLDEYIINDDKCDTLVVCQNNLLKQEKDCMAKLSAINSKGDKYYELYTDQVENANNFSVDLDQCYQKYKALRDKLETVKQSSERVKRNSQSHDTGCVIMKYEDISAGVEETYKKLIQLEYNVLDGNVCKEKLAECKTELLKKERECRVALIASVAPDIKILKYKYDSLEKDFKVCLKERENLVSQKQKEIDALKMVKSIFIKEVDKLKTHEVTLLQEIELCKMTNVNISCQEEVDKSIMQCKSQIESLSKSIDDSTKQLKECSDTKNKITVETDNALKEKKLELVELKLELFAEKHKTDILSKEIERTAAQLKDKDYEINNMKTETAHLKTLLAEEIDNLNEKLQKKFTRTKQKLIDDLCNGTQITTIATAEALYKASGYGRVEEVRELLKNCTDPNGLWTKADFGQSALILAAQNGHVEILQLLLDFGAYVDSRNSVGSTALMFASFGGHADVVRELLSRGALVNLLDADNRSAVFYASRHGRVEVLKLLIAAKAELNMPDRQNLTPLSVAATQDNRDKRDEVVRLLKEGEANRTR